MTKARSLSHVAPEGPLPEIGLNPANLTTINLTLVVTTSPGQISFSGIVSPEVPGQGGIISLSNAQADVAAIYHVSNLNTLLFDYTIGVSGSPVANGRNLLLDGDNLAEALAPCGPVTNTFVPEPGTSFLMLLTAGLSGLRRRR